MATVVFDLDGTIVDSSHRAAAKPCGAIDLQHWFDNCHRVVDDTLLPLAKYVRTFFDAGNDIVFCTARSMQQADHDWLARHADVLPHHAFYSRAGRWVAKDSPEYADSFYGFIGDDRDDGVIKIEQITAHITAKGFRNFKEAEVIIFEDNLKTIDLFRQHRAIAINAVRANARMGHNRGELKVA